MTELWRIQNIAGNRLRREVFIKKTSRSIAKKATASDGYCLSL
jgi:hypothetical protein